MDGLAAGAAGLARSVVEIDDDNCADADRGAMQRDG
jgi:hypothetical protein